MIALPEGVKVYAGGREWTGEIPAKLCPDHLKPTRAATSVDVRESLDVPAVKTRG